MHYVKYAFLYDTHPPKFGEKCEKTSFLYKVHTQKPTILSMKIFAKSPMCS